jgi:hypothetical protein
MSTSPSPATANAGTAQGRRLSPVLLWFAVAAGPTAWAVHLAVAWSVTELGCLARSPAGVQLHGGRLGDDAVRAVWLGTLVPWAVTLAAVAACAVLTWQRRRLAREDGTDVLAFERVSLLLVLAWFLSLMSLASITGGGIAFAVLEPCT